MADKELKKKAVSVSDAKKITVYPFAMEIAKHGLHIAFLAICDRYVPGIVKAKIEWVRIFKAFCDKPAKMSDEKWAKENL